MEGRANICNKLKLDNLAGSRVANKSIDIIYDLPVGPTVGKSSGQLVLSNTNNLVKEIDQQVPNQLDL